MSCFVAMKNPFVDQAILFSDASSREQAIEELKKLQVYIWPDISQEHFKISIDEREIPFSSIRGQKILAELFEAGIQPAKNEVLERARVVQNMHVVNEEYVNEEYVNEEYKNRGRLVEEKLEEQPTIQEVVKVAEEKHLKEILNKIETQIKLIEVSSNDIATLATQFEIATCYDYKYLAYVKKLKNRSEKLWINLLESYAKLRNRVEKHG